MKRRPRYLLPLALLVALTVGCEPDAEAKRDQSEPLLVAAASDLQPAFAELGPAFEEEAGVPVTFVFGSSGQLAQQLVEGAPMDVFASANAAYVDAVLASGRGNASTRRTYGTGRLVIWSRPDEWGDWSSLAELVADPEATTLAIANPDHAPYGLAARQALETAGLADDVEDRLVLGENVVDTQRLAASGNADAALIALSLALAGDQRDEGSWLLLDEALHEPLRQDLLVVADGAREADAASFVEFLTGTRGRTAMRRYGFLPPGETPPSSWER